MAVLDWWLRTAVSAVLMTIMLNGCSTPSKPPQEAYVPFAVETPVSCVPKTLAPKPDGLKTPEELAAIPDGPSRYVAMAEDWFLRVKRMNDTESVIIACQAVGAAP